ncbi:histone-like nucleoid-structuring protein Lsr2 [Streptomyces millisiae]|uniref:Lsr2 family protein n=1 Tax=Streptomyces millisiae TaxID=3075542 RepID=A0ABU2LZP7_9ACTN|nr:Lsr2 family protein [Streptomyces sp. DSM 44918]MDT0323054.1 Lsr2 family protein [Streptomyces sp. DSM 44918]
MAQKVVTIYSDDLTGEESTEIGSHRFSLDGVEYEIDLTPDSFDKLLDALGPFIEKGRKLGRVRRAPSSVKRSVPGVDTAAIREWAKENGLEVNDRGRVPASIREAYEKVN